MPAVAVQKLPMSLQKALKAIAYAENVVEVRLQSEVSLAGAGEGKTFYLVNLANGEYRVPKKSEMGHAARLGRNAAVIQTSEGSHRTVATIYVGQATSVPMLLLDEKRPEAARFVPRSEDIARMSRGANIVPSVNRQREVENETAKLATVIDRERRRRAKSEDEIDEDAADEALARAEIILGAAESKVRTVTTHETGRVVPYGALRETALKRLGIEFGCNAPIYVTCANCHKVFALRAGTRVPNIPTCKNGCLCECGRPVSPRSAYNTVRGARVAGNEGHRAQCAECVSKSRADRITAARRSMDSELLRKARAAQAAESRARTHCSKGHEFAKVGRNSDGTCKQCRLEYQRAFRETNWARTHCPKGHELAKVGRNLDGTCQQCRTEQRALRAAKKKGE